MNQVAQAIIEDGEFTGRIRGYDRYGMFLLNQLVIELTRMVAIFYFTMGR